MPSAPLIFWILTNAIEPEWRIEVVLLLFWDGTQYLIGEMPGLYELLGVSHYWDGKECWIPKEVGSYNLNGLESYWDETRW